MLEALIEVTYQMYGDVSEAIFHAEVANASLRVDPSCMLMQTMRVRGDCEPIYCILLLTQEQLLAFLQETKLVLAPKKQRNGLTTLELTKVISL